MYRRPIAQLKFSLHCAANVYSVIIPTHGDLVSFIFDQISTRVPLNAYSPTHNPGQFRKMPKS